MKHLKLYENFISEEEIRGGIFYHGSTDKNLAGKKGIHVGTKLAATQALEARIGVPAEGEWDGTREYGKTLLAGKKSLETKPENKWKCTGFNCGRDVPVEDYYPTQRTEKATYSDRTEIPMNSKPIVFPVQIIGAMSNSMNNPHNDVRANSLMNRALKMGNARRGFYYINDGEDSGSISAVVPDKSFIRVLENIKLENIKVLSKSELIESENKWKTIVGGQVFYRWITKEEFEYLLGFFKLPPGELTYTYKHPKGDIEIHSTSDNSYDVAVGNRELTDIINNILKSK